MADEAAEIDVSGDGGCLKTIISPGDTEAGCPPAGSKVKVHYVGTLASDGSKFDSSRDRGVEFEFILGKGQVIKGWDVGVASMFKGEKALLKCTPEYAYGARGSPPKIPESATLHFEVELFSWAAVKKGKWEMDAAERIAEGAAGKAEGTTLFKAGSYAEAADAYRGAADYLHEVDELLGEAEEDAQKAKEALALEVTCELNAAQCRLKLGEPRLALEACNRALELEADNVKALYRRASAHRQLQAFADAKSDIVKACKLDPKNREMRELYENIKKVRALRSQTRPCGRHPPCPHAARLPRTTRGAPRCVRARVRVCAWALAGRGQGEGQGGQPVRRHVRQGEHVRRQAEHPRAPRPAPALLLRHHHRRRGRWADQL